MTDLVLRGYDGKGREYGGRWKCGRGLALGFDGGLERGDDFGAAAFEA